MSAFYPLTIKNLVHETKECVSISFEVLIELTEKYKYLPGQYLTLKLQVDGEEIRRSYSICSSDLWNESLTVAIKSVKLGKGSNFLNNKVKVGDVLEVMTPMGNFHTPMDLTKKRSFVLFAGGSGITPMMSIIKSVLKVEPLSNLILFYGNENEESIIFKAELDKLSKSYPDRLKVYHILNSAPADWKADFKGIMDVSKNKFLFTTYAHQAPDTEYFICGPGGMMDSVMNALTELKCDQSKIHIEYFIAPKDGQEKKEDMAYVASKLTVVCDGDEVVLDLKPDQSVLEAALAAGIDAPYACQGGSCCTCRAKLIEGKVHMKVNYALLESEVQEGFILTCQSHALTPQLIVDYDRGR
jgi:ring-1,2-phenylacetyl-CoA epoxidase subunit PaaE